MSYFKVILIGLLGAVGLSSTNNVHAESYDFQPGLWQSTTTTETIKMENVPDEMKEMMNNIAKLDSSMTDITSECIKSVKELLFNENEAQQCKVASNRISDKKVTFTMSCAFTEDADASGFEGAGEQHFDGDYVKTEVVYTLLINGMKIKKKDITNSRRIGDCI